MPGWLGQPLNSDASLPAGEIDGAIWEVLPAPGRRDRRSHLGEATILACSRPEIDGSHLGEVHSKGEGSDLRGGLSF